MVGAAQGLARFLRQPLRVDPSQQCARLSSRIRPGFDELAARGGLVGEQPLEHALRRRGVEQREQRERIAIGGANRIGIARQCARGAFERLSYNFV